MINLLPPEYISQVHSARFNAALRRWLIAGMVAIVGLLVLLGSGWVYIQQQSNNLSHSIVSTNTQLQTQNLSKVQKDSAEITGDVKVINQVLAREIRFSNLIQDMGKIMPPGTILGSLSLNKIDSAIDLSANATDYSSAAQIAVNLSDPKNGIFSKVDIVNISCSGGSGNYKCNATFKALFNSTVQKKYLSVPGSKS